MNNQKMKGLSGVDNLSAYEVTEKRELTDIGSMAVYCRHRKTGARVVLIANDDENKVFYIGFRTPPTDSTGVAHILEHSVLCGSEAFPVKDPFVELVKGSLNTFLNAMTYPDKTLYPVASCNPKDFQNLMHVYLDAVFHPNIYTNESIFRQEGWHYEVDEETGALSVNGVVYNEMKGAYSSAEDVLESAIINSLYPHTPYGVESGGDPDVIPTLTYEDFLAFHGKYYHPSNSYIYLYGDMDMAEKLNFLDEQYLSKFDALAVDSEIGVEENAGEKGRVLVKEYPLNDGEDADENRYFSVNFAVGESTDAKLCQAFDILDYALCSAPGAPLKEALVKKGIGKDVYSIWDNGIKQPYFSVIAKGCEENRRQEFADTVREVLEGLVRDGIDEKALLAGLNHFEFKFREADFGSYPKGLMYGLSMLDSWLYDEEKPFVHLELLDVFKSLREDVKSGYFEGLIQKYLLDCENYNYVVLKPQEGLMEKESAKHREKLAGIRQAMTDEEFEKVIQTQEALQLFQESEDSPEALATLPMLDREDLKQEIDPFVNEERMIADTPLLYHNLFTNGIGYLRMIFKVKDIPEDYFPYLGILKGCLGLLNTKNYSYGDLFNEINLTTGGMAAVCNVYSRVDDLNACNVTLEIKTKAFYDKLPEAIGLMKEIILTSDFGDAIRLKEILAESKSRMQGQMMSAGHSVAVGRALSYGSVSGCISEMLSGIPFYRLIAGLEEKYAGEQQALADKLQKLAEMIFRPENLMVDFVGDEEQLALMEEPVADFRNSLYTTSVEKKAYKPVPVRRNEGFMTAGQVQYVCRAGNFRKKGLEYTGALKVLKVMLGYEYLWINVRVKGGAYGCMCGFGRSGESYFVSYRDPGLDSTIAIYEKAAQAIQEYDGDERTMTQYIIGAISELDMPLNAAAKGIASLSAYMMGLTDEQRQLERNQILHATKEDIQALAEYIRAFMSDDFLCVVGNAAKLRENQEKFAKIENLF